MAHYYALNIAMDFIPFTTLKHQLEFLPIEQGCYIFALDLFPNLISKLFLNDINYDKNTRPKIQNLIDLMKNSFEQLLDVNDWMDPVTKKLAKEKLLAIQGNVGAPDIVFDENELEKETAQVSCHIKFCCKVVLINFNYKIFIH